MGREVTMLARKNNMHEKLNLRELVNFYDYGIASSKKHATAVNAMMGEELGVSMMLQYFKNKGEQIEALPGSCNQSTQKGHRLDKWFVRKKPDRVLLYQVEIKNWSVHSIGGTRAAKEWCELPLSSVEWTQYRKKVWGRRFNPEVVLRDPEARKVLTPMKPPAGFEKAVIEPVICFWEGMHPEGEGNVFFDVPLKGEKFDKLFVFSMSNFVHQLIAEGTDFLDVTMPDAVARKEWIEKLFCTMAA